MKTRIRFIRLAFEPVGLAGEFEFVHDGSASIETHLESAFAAFNRGSGSTIPFSGPSASVGDLFVVTSNDDFRFKEVWQIKSVGFRRIKCDLFDFEYTPVTLEKDFGEWFETIQHEAGLTPKQAAWAAWIEVGRQFPAGSKK